MRFWNCHSNLTCQTCCHFPFFVAKGHFLATFFQLYIYIYKFLNLEIFNIIRKGLFRKEAQVKIYKSEEQYRYQNLTGHDLKVDMLFDPTPYDFIKTQQHIPRDENAALAGALYSVTSCSKSLSLQPSFRHFTVF